MISPDEAAARVRAINRQYTIHVHHDLRPRRVWRWRPWWATITHGLFYVGYPTDLVWRASSRQTLTVRCERWVWRDALRNGIADPVIRLEGFE